MTYTLSVVLRMMADECQSGQRTGKSDRWALTLRDAARIMDQLETERDTALGLLRECREVLGKLDYGERDEDYDGDVNPGSLLARLDTLLPQASYPGRAPVLDPDGQGRDR